jgi:Ankyrin repeats (3 copies)
MCEANALPSALFTSTHALTCAETQSHETELIDKIVSAALHPATVTALLACSPIVESAGVVYTYGDTELMFAVKQRHKRHTQTVRALLSCPAVVATVGVVNTDGDTALMLASAEGNTPAVRALLACPAVVATVGVVNNNGYTALMIAEQHGHERMIELLRAFNVQRS